MPKPLSAAQLHRVMDQRIEKDGLDHTLRRYFSADYAEGLDPELHHLWQNYLLVSQAIEARLGREPPVGAVRSEPPRGYMPFQSGYGMGDPDTRWICATPFCDSVDDLLYQGDSAGAWETGAQPHASASRICRQFKTRGEAVAACWEHAALWWGGEPPPVDAIGTYRALPEGWAIFIGRDHNMWITGPNQGGHGKISGSCLSSALQCYADECWREVEGA